MSDSGDYFAVTGLEDKQPSSLLPILFEISDRLDSRFDEKSIWRHFQFLASELKERCRDKDAQTSLEILCEFIFETKKFQTLSKKHHASQEHLLCGSLFEDRNSHPLVVSVLFAALGEQIGLQLQVIDEPQFSMIRWCDSSAKNSTTKLIHMSNEGQILSSEEIVTWCNQILDDDEAKELPSLRSLNAKTLLEHYLTLLLGTCLHQHDKAVFVVDLLLELQPSNIELLRQKALLSYELGLLKDALLAIQRMDHFHAGHKLPPELLAIKNELSKDFNAPPVSPSTLH